VFPHLPRQGFASSAAHPIEGAVRSDGSSKRLTRFLASSASRPTPSLKTISRSCPAARSKLTWIAAQGSSAAPTLPERRVRVIAAGLRSVPLRPGILSDCAYGASRVVHVENATRSRNSVLYGCAQKARRTPGHFGDHVHARFGPQVAQHPFRISGSGEPAGSARDVTHSEHRELDCCVQGHVNPQLGADAALSVFEDTVAESVPSNVRRCPAAGQWRG